MPACRTMVYAYLAGRNCSVWPAQRTRQRFFRNWGAPEFLCADFLISQHGCVSGSQAARHTCSDFKWRYAARPEARPGAGVASTLDAHGGGTPAVLPSSALQLGYIVFRLWIAQAE